MFIKNTFLTVLAALGMMCVKGQQATNISGTVDNQSGQKVALYKVQNGRLVEIATSVPDGQGRFGFRFIPEYEGLYSLGTGNSYSQYGLYRFYFKGNEQLNVKLGKGSYELIGENSPENKLLSDWDHQSEDMRNKATNIDQLSTYVDFFPEMESFKEKTGGIADQAKTANIKFNKLFADIIKTDFAFYSISYLYMPRSAHPGKEEMTEFYTSFNADEFLTDDLLNFPYGDRFLTNLIYWKGKSASNFTFDKQVESIPSDILKGQFVLQRLERARSYSDYEELNAKYKKYFLLSEQKDRATVVETKLVETKIGVPAFQFSFPDSNGKKIGLADLKGNVVLIDMWATWCGPCRAEEPHWEKLNLEFKGKPVVFVGVSTDKNKSKWEAYIKEKSPKGIQLHAGADNPLSNAYKVNTIPRYILIDKSGNLITADSPRPSDPKLRDMIGEWIKK